MPRTPAHQSSASIPRLKGAPASHHSVIGHGRSLTRSTPAYDRQLREQARCGRRVPIAATRVRLQWWADVCRSVVRDRVRVDLVGGRWSGVFNLGRVGILCESVPRLRRRDRSGTVPGGAGQCLACRDLRSFAPQSPKVVVQESVAPPADRHAVHPPRRAAHHASSTSTRCSTFGYGPGGPGPQPAARGSRPRTLSCDGSRRVSDQSMALSVMPAWATDGIANRTPETTRKIPVYSQPRTRRVMTLTPLLELTEKSGRIRRRQGIRWDGRSGPAPGPYDGQSNDGSEPCESWGECGTSPSTLPP